MADVVTKTKPPRKLSDRVIGDRPAHRHEFEEESWMCNSPYCEAVKGVPHPDDGGPEPIQIGREPWRGLRG